MSFLNGISQCMFCGGVNFVKAAEYHKPPPGETVFNWKQNYSRSYVKCEKCSHYYSQHDLDLTQIYDSEYVDTVYDGTSGMKRTFEKIISLPEDMSDNASRCSRIHDRFKKKQGLNLLDVGAGLGVFPYGMNQKGWECTAIDMDPRQVDHLQNNVGIKAFNTPIPAEINLGKFDLISFNKVLEHIEDPVPVLRAAKDLLKTGGSVYIELPDGEGAADDSFDREEFYVEHHHVFSFSSFSLYLERSGFRAVEMQRIIEPSTKYTLFAFAEPV